MAADVPVWQTPERESASSGARMGGVCRGPAVWAAEHIFLVLWTDGGRAGVSCAHTRPVLVYRQVIYGSQGSWACLQMLLT